jgi:dsRNA-specific ribonuclease
MNHMQRALVHASASQTENNELLEYLGDSVLQLIASEYLFTYTPISPRVSFRLDALSTCAGLI